MADSTSPVDDLIGTHLEGGYEVRHVLGQGAMGKVYAGVQHPQGKEVAIKVIAVAGGANLYWHKRFIREATITSKLASPHAIRLLHFGHTESGMPFMVMELLKGRELAAEIAATAPMEPARAMRIGRQILRSLAEAHGLGIVHRDLKPRNVFMRADSADDHAKVMDFGLAATHAEPGLEKLTKTGVVMGTPAYMAPEQAIAGKSDARSDLYAFGIILFEMLTGKRPFVADAVVKLLLCQIKAAPPRIADLRPELAPRKGLQTLLDELLAKDPDERPVSAKAVLDRLDELERIEGSIGLETTLLDLVPDLPGAAENPSPPARRPRPRRPTGPRQPARARPSAATRRVTQQTHVVEIEVSLSARPTKSGEVTVQLQGLDAASPGELRRVRGLKRVDHIWRGTAEVHTVRPAEVRLCIDLAGNTGAPWRVRIWRQAEPPELICGRRGRLQAARQRVEERMSLEGS